ncbi:sugar-binding transcriptional regulator [Prosthecomicrobium pneumaticum]|uniref:Deoxyribonucleoside regulator n=1 Tax=Prosthecomicrobium pneumaticum TaxID=81895 RepID=A0A7W9FKM6_9HYPH|nr:sugar-binding domain-containing protein [Prosthecomicrobium pneumaticum]MBB5751093.1 deoxyribonucleoside regulator [Prosthecomicrobium pneumaticum]
MTDTPARSAETETDTPLRGLSAEAREPLMIQAAKLYYDLERTQTEIGRALGLNRFQVARLLREAREIGLVRIEIAPRANRLPALETRLQKAFGLAEAVIVQETDDAEGASLPAVAEAAARYLAALGPRLSLIGVSWGRTMSAVAERLPAGWAEGVEVVLLNGATHLRSTRAPTNAVAERFAAAARGTATLLPVPAILGQAATRDALVADPIIRRVLDRGAEAPVACFGLGSLPADSVLVQSGYIDGETMLRLRAQGAVGDILGRVIGPDGAISDPALDARTIGLAPAALRDKALSIGISAGRSKHAVVLAALRARYVNVLVADESTARHVLGES